MFGDVVHRLWDLEQTGLAGDAIGLKIGWSAAAVLAHIREHRGLRPRWGRELQGRSLAMGVRERILELEGQHGVREIARPADAGRDTSTRPSGRRLSSHR